MIRSVMLSLLLLTAIAAAGCGKSPGPSDTNALFKQENTPENLQKLVEAIVKASESADLARAGALMRGLFVDADTLKMVFKDDVSSAQMTRQIERLKGIPASDAELATLMKRGSTTRTQINVHGAMTAEIIAGQSAVAIEFKDAVELAADLKPDIVFYEVEFVEPGKPAGMKYHMFFWDGSRWRMLGPAWR